MKMASKLPSHNVQQEQGSCNGVSTRAGLSTLECSHKALCCHNLLQLEQSP